MVLRITLQWLSGPESGLEIRSNVYSDQIWFQEYAIMVTVPKIGFKNMLQWLSCPESGSEIRSKDHNVQNRI
jgi:hypothetical protein